MLGPAGRPEDQGRSRPGWRGCRSAGHTRRYRSYLREVQQAASTKIGGSSAETKTLRRERDQAQRQVEKLIDFVAEGDSSSGVRDCLAALEAKVAEHNKKIAYLETIQRDPVMLMPSAVQSRLAGLVSLLQSDPVRARPVLNKLLPEPVIMHLVDPATLQKSRTKPQVCS